MIHESLCDSKPEALAWPVRTHYTPLELCAAVTHTSISVPCHYTCVTEISEGFFSLSFPRHPTPYTCAGQYSQDKGQTQSVPATLQSPKQHSVLGIPLHFKTIHSNVQYIYIWQDLKDKICLLQMDSELAALFQNL